LAPRESPGWPVRRCALYAGERAVREDAVIFQRSLIREFSSFAIAVFATLFAITLTTQLIRLLGQAAIGRVLSEGVLALLAFSALNYLPVLLSLTLFVSVLMALSRSYRDSEMVVWFSSGQSLTAWAKPVLVFAAPFIVLIGALSFFLSPWAVGKADEYRRQMENRDDVARIAPGVFREASGTDRVFFVEQVPGDEAKVQNVFVAQVEKGILSVLVSQQGFTETVPDGDRYVVLLNGRRYDGSPGMPGYRIMDFERYALRIEAREIGSVQTSTKAMSSLLLAQSSSNAHRAELLWRLGLPISALNLALLAIPLSFVNPRASRSVNLIFALLTYMVYSNLVSIVQAWVSQGRMGFGVGWWAVHAAMFGLLVVLFWTRLRVRPLLSFRG
jgi:lipopolysaccharide export system permease protein